VISLKELSNLPRGESFKRIFQSDELVEVECCVTHVDHDLLHALISIWIVLITYPQTLPKRWPANGKLIGVKLSISAKSSTLQCVFPVDTTQLSSSTVSVVSDIEASTGEGFRFEAKVAAISVVSVVPLAGGDGYGVEHIGKQIGKF
jgi:hypothetical protein